MRGHRWCLPAVLLLLLLLLSFVLSAGPTRAAGTGSISGNVSGGATEGTLLLAGPCVAAYDSGGTQVGFVRAAANGDYTIGNLVAGDYRLEIIDCAARLGHFPGVVCVGAAAANCLLPGVPSEFYDNQRTLEAAATVSVAEGMTTTGIDARFGTSGGISGTVTDTSGNPLSGVCVQAFRGGSYWGPYPVGEVAHTDDGKYTVKNLAADSYSLTFRDCLNTEDPFVTEYHSRASVAEDTITTGVDVQLVTNPDPSEAVIDEVSVKGPAKTRKGKRVTYRVTVKNSGSLPAIDVEVKVRARGINSSESAGKIAAGSTKTIPITLIPRKSGKKNLSFYVKSSNAGKKRVTKRIFVRR